MTPALLLKVDSGLNRLPPYAWTVRYRLHVSLLFLLAAALQFAPYLRERGAAPLLAFFCWHFALYVYNRYTDREEDRLNNPNEALDDADGRRALWLTLVLLATGGLLLAVARFPTLYYVLSLPFVFLYGQPLLGGRLRIKRITVVKNLYAILCCWCLPFTLLYMTYDGTLPLPRALVYANLHLFITVAIYELFWDIRDVKGDRLAGVRTIPVRVGVGVTRGLLLLAIAAGVAAKWMLFGVLDWHYAVFFLFFLAVLDEDAPPFLFHLMIFGQLLMIAGYLLRTLY